MIGYVVCSSTTIPFPAEIHAPSSLAPFHPSMTIISSYKASQTTALHCPTQMAPLTSTTSTTLRACIRHRHRFSPLKVTPVLSQQRGKADAVQRTSGEYDRTPSFASPFTNDANPTTKIPSFKAYMSKRGETSNKTFQYFMVGTMGLLSAAGAKATVQGRAP